jgi:hypothetical protein
MNHLLAPLAERANYMRHAKDLEQQWMTLKKKLQINGFQLNIKHVQQINIASFHRIILIILSNWMLKWLKGCKATNKTLKQTLASNWLLCIKPCPNLVTSGRSSTCCHSLLVWWCGGAVVRWCSGVVVRWCSGAVVQWCSGAVVRWCGGAVVQWCGGAVFY